ncbi:MAG: serine protease, partial [Pirellulales bacterium]|nr:serine protease [Pirellulales bacterium]
MKSIARTLVLVVLMGIGASSRHVLAQQLNGCWWSPSAGWQCPAPTSNHRAGRPARQTPAEEIVRVIVPHADGRTEDRGSGVLVVGPDDNHGWILTAEHVTNGRAEAIALFPSGRRYRAEVAASDRAADIALLRIAKPNVSPRRVADAPPAMAAEVYLAGYPRGGAYRSWVTRRTTLYESAGRIEVSGHSENGTSGGPMIDARGRVV